MINILSSLFKLICIDFENWESAKYKSLWFVNKLSNAIWLNTIGVHTKKLMIKTFHSNTLLLFYHDLIQTSQISKY